MPTLEESRRHCRSQLDGFHAGIKRLVNPHDYPAGVAENLFELRNQMILDLKGP